jgi:hypothetical protein
VFSGLFSSFCSDASTFSTFSSDSTFTSGCTHTHTHES